MYLTLVGAVIAFAAYSYALKHLDMAIVSLYSYVNPVIAVALGTIILGEPFNARMAAAIAMIAVGVVVVGPMTRKASRSHANDVEPHGLSPCRSRCSSPASRPASRRAPTRRRASRACVAHCCFWRGAPRASSRTNSVTSITGLAFDAHPRARRLDYGPIPFFSIQHDTVTRRQEFVITSSGFWMQHAGSEWILTAHPNLASKKAPVLKGVLAFNLAASTVYSAAAFGRFGPPERDTRAMADTLGKDGIPEPVIGLLVLAPAALDGYRYLDPESQWAKWTSRGVKVLAVVLTMAAGR